MNYVLSRVQALRLAAIPALALLGLLGGCGGGGGGVGSTPAPVSSPTPTPTATPTPTPTATTPAAPALIPASTFITAEYNRSDGPSFHNVIPAWQTGATGKGVTLGIVDTGIDTTNPEFAGRISPASADVAGTRGMVGADSHGTQVALTAAAARNDSGIVGIAYDATILMARADDPGSCATSGGCAFNDTAIAAGINLAVANGAKVVNLSLGGAGASPAVLRAVADAATAGVVIVVSAGNGTNHVGDPDPTTFAQALRQAGSGNVIIAGSVDGTGTISSFSNRAGTEAASYLAALGEQICCVYENGQIKVTTDSSGQSFITVVSGTSFAAPQIAGAVALLRQAFPTLTAQQVVSLLLSSATDAGAAGTDPIYGRGILNIGNAFAAKGTTSLAGTSAVLAPADSALVTSAAMGDATSGVKLSATVLDAYRRAYTVNLGASFRQAALAPRLGLALLGTGHPVNATLGNASLAFTTGQDAARPLGWSDPLRLSPADAQAARVLAGRVVARIAPHAVVALGFAQSADALVAQVQGADRPAFLIAPAAHDDFGFDRRDLLSTAVRHQLGRFGLTVAADAGRVAEPALRASARDRSLRDRPGVARIGLTLDRTAGPVTLGLGASWLAEDRTVLGARLAPGLGARGADSAFLDAGLDWQVGARLRVGASYRRGYTQARAGGTVLAASRLASSAWSLDLARRGLFAAGDSLALRLSQPLRVESGGLALLLPTGWNYGTQTASDTFHRINLVPSGREIDAELAWHGPLAGGTASASLFWRRDPGHMASLPPERGLAASWRVGF